MTVQFRARLETAFYMRFFVASRCMMRFLWPFVVPLFKNPRKMRLICYFSTALGIKMNTHSSIQFFREQRGGFHGSRTDQDTTHPSFGGENGIEQQDRGRISGAFGGYRD